MRKSARSRGWPHPASPEPTCWDADRVASAGTGLPRGRGLKAMGVYYLRPRTTRRPPGVPRKARKGLRGSALPLHHLARGGGAGHGLPGHRARGARRGYCPGSRQDASLHELEASRAAGRPVAGCAGRSPPGISARAYLYEAIRDVWEGAIRGEWITPPIGSRSSWPPATPLSPRPRPSISCTRPRARAGFATSTACSSISATCMSSPSTLSFPRAATNRWGRPFSDCRRIGHSSPFRARADRPAEPSSTRAPCARHRHRNVTGEESRVALNRSAQLQGGTRAQGAEGVQQAAAGARRNAHRATRGSPTARRLGSSWARSRRSPSQRASRRRSTTSGRSWPSPGRLRHSSRAREDRPPEDQCLLPWRIGRRKFLNVQEATRRPSRRASSSAARK